MKLAVDTRSQLEALVADQRGEFDLHDLVPAVVEMLRDQPEEALAEVALKVLKQTLRRGDPLNEPSDQGVLFEYAADRRLAVGDARYCRMADFTAAHVRRRRVVITRNYKAVSQRWREEDDYWERVLSQLEEHAGTLSDLETE
jgi:hypothetical protein